MGSYLMACAMTNATITEGAEVVAYPMTKETSRGRGSSDMFNREWFISGLPIFGTYNDYGNVLDENGDEHNSSELGLMIMYRWAWDVVVGIVRKEQDEEDARYVEYNRQGLGYENYRLKRLAEAKEAIDAHIKHRDSKIPDPMKMSPKEREDLAKNDPDLYDAMVDVLLSKSKTSSALQWFGEGAMAADSFWKKTILDAEDPHQMHDDFRKYILPIVGGSYSIFYRLAPSMYGSQESNAREMIQLYEAGLTHFKAYIKRWDEE